jgi:hypothetical protein
MQYATCTANRPTSIGSSSNGLTTNSSTGKSLSEALIFASTNPQYDDRLFIELKVQYMKIPSSNLGRTCCVQKLFLTSRTTFVHNMFSPCTAKRRASDKNLPVSTTVQSRTKQRTNGATYGTGGGFL